MNTTSQKQLCCTLLLLASLAPLFQNCSGSHYRDPASTGDRSDFFNYAYKAAPVFYNDLMFLKPAGQLEGLHQFKFVGSLAHPADTSAPIHYELTVKTLDGVTMCPARSGDLEIGNSLIMFDCATEIDSDEAVVELVATSGSDSETISKIFR